MDERQYGEDISSQPLPPEFAPLPDEYGPDPGLEFLPPPDDCALDGAAVPKPKPEPAPAENGMQKRHRSVKQLFLMPVAATLAALSVLFASVGYDPLSLDIFSGSGSSSSAAGETADLAFPTLSNLNPNGPAVGYGVLNQEYIQLLNGSSRVYLEAGTDYTDNGTVISSVPGISYDRSTNTVTLNNFNYPGMLELNWMGNGLKLVVNGANSIGHLLVWGFYYGGSITITGSGSLTVNQDPASNDGAYDHQYDGYGIYLQAENSDSCLMIDSTVKLDVYGSEAAILVQDSSFRQGIYYLAPLSVAGGERVALPFIEEAGTSCYSFRDPETQTLAKHLIFQ